MKRKKVSSLLVTRNLGFLIIEKLQLRVSLQRQLLCISLIVEHNNEEQGN